MDGSEMANEVVSSDTLAFRQMLVKLDSKITPQELEKMKIYCKDILGTKIRDQIRSFVALCEKLEERKCLSRKEMTFFKKMLTDCTDGRLDVLDILNEFRNQSHKSPVFESDNSEHREDLKKETTFLINNLGRDWKFFMRELGVQEAVLDMCIDAHPRNVREQIHAAFKEWQEQSEAVVSREALLTALKNVKRNDLFQKINSGILS